MSFEFFIASRYLIRRRKGLFAFVTTTIAIAGITLGVGALIITLAVMSGFHAEIQRKILSIQAHVILGSKNSSGLNTSNYKELSEKVSSIKGVKATSPFIYSQIVLRNRESTTGAIIKGIDFSKEDKISDLKKYIVSGKWEKLDEGIVLGKTLAKSLNAFKGDEIVLISPAGIDSTLVSIPKMKMLKVTGIFESGMYDYDANLAYISIPNAQKLLDLGTNITAIGIKIDNIDKTELLSQLILKEAGPNHWVQTWQSLNRNLFSALKLEKLMMFIILTLIVLVASSNIISNLLLFTIEKVRDIGILSALGATKGNIYRIFMYEGFIMGGIGISLGTFIGCMISYIVNKFQIIKLPPDIYYLESLPVKLFWGDVILVIISAAIIIILSTIYPAKKAADTDPLDAIRYG